MNNSTSPGPASGAEYSFTYKIFGIILIPIALGGFLGSILCVWTIWKGSHHRQRISSKLLFINLCLATFLFCGLVCPFHIYAEIVQRASLLATRRSGQALCNFLAFSHFTTLTASAYAHSVIAVNRLLAVVITGRLHALAKSKWYIGSLIALTWIVSGATFAAPLFGGGGAYGFSVDSMKCSFTALFSPTYVIMYKVINSLVPFVIMVVCYVCIFWTVFLSKRRVLDRRQLQAAGMNPVMAVNESRSAMREIRVTKIAFVTCVTFFACYLPSAVYGVSGRTRQELQSPLGIGLNYLWWTGCAVNPLVYAYLNATMEKRTTAWLSARTGFVKRKKVSPAYQPSGTAADNGVNTSVKLKSGEGSLSYLVEARRKDP
ncbi:hypothetical protein BV898_05503 [Hypsibius exemplaris]|uniref:G-protein coupled receptors family 1 profile domain-containing protein n=1 Tax=Hypsibius exemplaris TaxID=2072580 RepID=A0A1W0WZ26_HYPEX|nr:hypothetical protein BV898_05503 [Hypsibius exemplaris]